MVSLHGKMGIPVAVPIRDDRAYVRVPQILEAFSHILSDIPVDDSIFYELRVREEFSTQVVMQLTEALQPADRVVAKIVLGNSEKTKVQSYFLLAPMEHLPPPRIRGLPRLLTSPFVSDAPRSGSATFPLLTGIEALFEALAEALKLAHFATDPKIQSFRIGAVSGGGLDLRQPGTIGPGMVQITSLGYHRSGKQYHSLSGVRFMVESGIERQFEAHASWISS